MKTKSVHCQQLTSGQYDLSYLFSQFEKYFIEFKSSTNQKAKEIILKDIIKKLKHFS